MSLTSSGKQAITTIHNLNMEGVFNNTSTRQFKNLNTCEITYNNTNLNNGIVETQKNIKIYDGIFQKSDTFTPTGSNQDSVDFVQNSTGTAQELTNTLNSLYKCRIYYNTGFDTSASGTITIGYDNNGSISSSTFVADTDFSLSSNADITASNLAISINNNTNLNAEIDLINKLIIVSTRSGINLSLDTTTNTITGISSLKIENYQKVFNVLPTEMNGTAINTFKAEITYDNNIFTDNVNTHKIELVYDGGIVTFQRGIHFNIATPTQDVTTNANATAENLRQAIDTYPNANFTSTVDDIDTVNKKITVTTTSNSDLSLVNNTRTGDGITSITNFFHQVSTNNNGKIKLTQETSNEYNNNSIVNFDNDELVISDFTVLEGSGADFPHNAAIPSETIGTYQIMNKFIESLSSIKKRILDRSKVLQEDLSNDHSDGNVTLTQNNSSTHQSIITADQSRGNLLATSEDGSTNANNKPSLIEIENDTDTIKYSEDALFTFFKGIGYEVFKLESGISGNNNSAGSTNAGIGDIPISIIENDTGNTATLRNVISTLHNISRTGNINITETTSEDSIPRDSIGLIDLINRIIIETIKIKREIKNTEINIINALKINNDTPQINPATFESKNNILKKRGNFLEDFNSSDENSDKPSIYRKNGNGYSEDAIFSLFACLTFELMKLLNGKKAKNNEGNEAYAGLAVIPASIENI